MQVGAAQSTSGSPVSLPWQKRTRKGRKEKHSYKNRLWWQLHPSAMNPSGLWVSQPLFPSFLLHHHLRRSPSSYRKMCKHSSNLANTSLSPSHLLKPNLWSNPPTRIRCLSRDELSHHLGRDFLVLWLVRIKKWMQLVPCRSNSHTLHVHQIHRVTEIKDWKAQGR